MKSQYLLKLLFTICIFVLVANNNYAQNNKTTWKLMDPADLVRIMETQNLQQPIVFCIGPANYIEKAIHIDPAEEGKNREQLKQELKKLSKNTEIVAYCGCCPFQYCPNIRPAMNILNNMGFTNHIVLNLPHNFKVDWIDKGYPVSDK